MSNQPRAVLLASDFSQAALRAEEAARWVVAPGGRIVVLHVVDALTVAGSGRSGVVLQREAEAVLLRDAWARVDAAVERLGDGGVEVRGRVVEGTPARGVIEVAREESAEAIVLGTHGLGGFKRFLLGSVADEVSRHSEVVVVLVP